MMHHDLIQLPNGNYLGIIEESSLGVIPIGDWTSSFQSLGFQADGSTVEFPWIGDKLVEWDKDTKEIVWSWSVFDHFNMEDYDEYGGTWNQAYIDLQIYIGLIPCPSIFIIVFHIEVVKYTPRPHNFFCVFVPLYQLVSNPGEFYRRAISLEP